MLGDVGQPQPGRPGRGGVPLDQVVVDRRARLLEPAPCAGVRGDDPGLRADLPHPPLGDLVAGVGELVGDEPVLEARVVPVDLECSSGGMAVDQVPLTDRDRLPGIEGLPREPPAARRSPRRGSRRRQGPGPAGTSFWGLTQPQVRLRQVRRSARSTSFSCSRSRILRLASLSSAFSAAVLPGRTPSSTSAWRSQFRRHDSEIPKLAASLAIGASPLRATATTSSRNSFGWGAGMSTSSQRSLLGPTDQVSTEPSAVPYRHCAESGRHPGTAAADGQLVRPCSLSRTGRRYIGSVGRAGGPGRVPPPGCCSRGDAGLHMGAGKNREQRRQARSGRQVRPGRQPQSPRLRTRPRPHLDSSPPDLAAVRPPPHRLRSRRGSTRPDDPSGPRDRHAPRARPQEIGDSRHPRVSASG